MVINYKNFEINTLQVNEDKSLQYEVHFGDAPVIEPQATESKGVFSQQLAEIKKAIDDIVATFPPALSYQPNPFEDEDY